MNEFARVLSKIIEKEKEKQQLTIKEFAEHAGITASYLSNLKQANRKPPAQKTLTKLTNALRLLGVAEADVQQLISAYYHEQLDLQENSLFLETLLDTFQEDDGVLEILKRGVQTKGLVLKKGTKLSYSAELEPFHTELIKGDHQIFLQKAIYLFEKAATLEGPGQRLYLTSFHDALDSNGNQGRQALFDILRYFLWIDSPFELLYLCSTEFTRNLTAIISFLKNYIGTTHCTLYEVPNAPYLPEYAVVEDLGFVEARRTPDAQYWIRTVLTEDTEQQYSTELTAAIDFLEGILREGNSRKIPLIQTVASLDQFSVTPILEKLTEAEQQSSEEERLLIKPSFSSIYRTVETLCDRLRTLNLPQEEITSYMATQAERIQALEQHLKQGKERAIHSKQFLSQEFHLFLGDHFAESTVNNAGLLAELELLKRQILTVLKAVRDNPNLALAFIDELSPIKFEIAGDTAFIGFDFPDSQHVFPFEQDQLMVLVWTRHPDMLYRLRREFDTKWRAIDTQWRTDNEQGRQYVLNFIAAETLKLLLHTNIPSQEFWTFIQELAHTAKSLDTDAFTRERYTHEQVAHDLLFVHTSFPTITIPADVGPWDPKSAIRTRQHLVPSILKNTRLFRMVSTQAGIETYLETNRYTGHQFTREETRQHVYTFLKLLTEMPDTMILEIVPRPETLPVNFEIVDEEFVFIENTVDGEDEGGVMLSDTALAQELITYIEKHLTAKCPDSLKEGEHVVQWLHEKLRLV